MNDLPEPIYLFLLTGLPMAITGLLAYILGQHVGKKKSDQDNKSDLICFQNKVNELEAAIAAQENLLLKTEHWHQKNLELIQSNHDKSLVKMRDGIRAMTVESIQASQPALVEFTQKHLEDFRNITAAQLATKQKTLEAFIKPLESKLEHFDQSIKSQVEKLAIFQQVSESLASETNQLSSILQSNQSRGIWGEQTLKRVLEESGLSPYCDFQEQPTQDQMRPDLIISLPDDRKIIIDSKFPLPDDIENLDIPKKKTQILSGFASKLRTTIKELAQRNYPKKFSGSLDYVILFLPAESLLSWALEADKEILHWAHQKKIFLSTPAQIIALAQMIQYLWKMDAQTQNASAIAQEASSILKQLQKMGQSLDSTEKYLKQATEAHSKVKREFNNSLGSSANSLKKLGIDDGQN